MSKAQGRCVRRFNRLFDLGYSRPMCALYSSIDARYVERTWRDCMRYSRGPRP